jgi:hypothetical protein
MYLQCITHTALLDDDTFIDVGYGFSRELLLI